MSQSVRTIQENASDREVRDVLRTVAKLLRSGTFTWDPPNVPASTVTTTALGVATYPSLAGLVAGMPVTVTPPSSLTAGIIVQAWVSATDELTISLTNITASPIDMGSATWGFMGMTS